MKRPSTILFVPCYNEEGRIGRLLERIAEAAPAVDELLVVDDGSNDGSLEQILQSPIDCTVLRHTVRLGLGEAFRTAYRHTLRRGYAIFCVMAGNGKDDPDELDQLLGPVQRGEADYVQGSRFHPDGGRSERLPLHRNLAIRLFTRVVAQLCGRQFTDCSNGFRAYRTSLLEQPQVDWCAPWLGWSYQIEIYLLIAAARSGFRIAEVPTSKVYPDDGRSYSKAVLLDWLRMCKPLLWCALRLDRLRGGRRAPGEPVEGQLETVRMLERRSVSRSRTSGVNAQPR